MLKRLWKVVMYTFLFSLVLVFNHAGVDLSVDVIATPETPQAGTSFRYQITVANLGDMPATELMVTNTLDARLQIINVEAVSGEIARSGRFVTARFAALSAGASATVEITARGNQLGAHPITVTAFAAETETVLHNNLLTIETEIIQGSNLFPSVTLVDPAIDAALTACEDIVIRGVASDADDGLAKVEAFVNDVRIGEKAGSPFEFIWPKASRGNFNVRVIATDTRGAVSVDGRTVTVDWNKDVGFVIQSTQGGVPAVFYVGEPGVGYRIDVTSNLSQWMPLDVFDSASISAEILDSSSERRRFYRATKFVP